MALRIVEIQRHRRAARLRRDRSVDAHQGPAIAMPQRQKLFQQPAGQAAHALGDRLDADRLEIAQPDLHGGNRQIVQRAVFEAGLARR